MTRILLDAPSDLLWDAFQVAQYTVWNVHPSPRRVLGAQRRNGHLFYVARIKGGLKVTYAAEAES